MAEGRWATPEGRPPWEWRQVYRSSEGVGETATCAGVSDREAAKNLITLGIRNDFYPGFFQRLLPEDLGLSPLNCVECGAEAIGGHPCPECSHDPRDCKKSRYQQELLSLLDDAAGAVPERELLKEVRDRTVARESKDRRRHYIKELERIGHVERVDDDPPAYRLSKAASERRRGDERPRVAVGD